MNNIHRTATICCYICNRTFSCRIDLYEHFQNVHHISQEFRDKFIPFENKQMAKRSPSKELNRDHLNKQINEMNKTQHTIAYPTSQVPDNVQPAVTLSTVVSSLEHSLPSISVRQLTTEHIGPNSVRDHTVAIAAGLSEPMETTANLNAGLTLHPQPQRSIYHPYNPLPFYNSNRDMNETQPTSPDNILPAVTSSTVVSSSENNLPSISVRHLPTQHIRPISVSESTGGICTDGAKSDKPTATCHYFPTNEDLNAGFPRQPQRPYDSRSLFDSLQFFNGFHNILEAARKSDNFGDQFNLPPPLHLFNTNR